MKAKKILLAGEILADFIVTKTLKDIVSFNAYPGGSVFNTAVILSRLGIKTSIISKLGKDHLGNFLINFANKENIETDYIFQDEKLTTPLALAQIDTQGNSHYSFYKIKGKQLIIKRNHLPENLFKNVAVFHTGSSYSYNDYTHQTVTMLIKLAREANVFISYDPNIRLSTIKNKYLIRQRISNILKKVDLLKMSEDDLLFLTGEKIIKDGYEKLKNITSAFIVVTLGERVLYFLMTTEKK
jgi:fructokinase